MKKTISIHLMGTNFLVEEDAYELVRDYLDRLKSSLGNSSDRKEISEDVELRIAELATAYVNEKKQVVTLEEMKHILDTLGQPEEFLDEEMQENQHGGNSSYETIPKSERRLFRDTDNGMIAGLCAGLAAYFKVDVIVFRIIFVILGFAGGFIVPLYLIMWLVIPRAKTNLERLQMQGRPINLETLKEEFEDAAQRISRTSKKFESDMSDMNSPVRRRINYAGNIIAKIVGVGLLVFGSIGLVMLLVFGFLDVHMFPFTSETQFNYNELGDIFLADKDNAFYLWLGGFITGFAGVAFTILLGSVLLFRLKSKWIKRSFLIIVLVGVGGILTCVYQGIRSGSEFAISGEYEQKVGEVSDSVLTVNILDDFKSDHVKNSHHRFDGELFEISNGKIVESDIDINYALSEDSNFHVYVEYSAQGSSKRKAVEKSKNIVHQASIEGNQLSIAPYYKYPKSDKVRNQSVALTIMIPEGKAVRFKNHTVSSADVRDSGEIDEDGEYEHYESDDDDWLDFNF